MARAMLLAPDMSAAIFTCERPRRCAGRLWRLLGLSAGCAGAAGLAACASDACGQPGVICTVAGTGIEGPLEDDVHPLDADLSFPADIGLDADDRPLIVDWNHNSIRRIDRDRMRIVLGTGALGDAASGPATSVSLNHPSHIGEGPDGALLVSTWLNAAVGHLDLDAGRFRRHLGDGQRDTCGDGGPASEASFDLPVATALDSQDRVYVMDMGSGRVRRIGADGVVETVVGPPPDAEGADACCADGACAPPSRRFGFAGDGGPARAAYLRMPFGSGMVPAGKIAIGSGDVLYIADTRNQRVRVVSLYAEERGGEPAIETFAGSGGSDCVPDDEPCPPIGGAYAGDGIAATRARLNEPTDVAVGPDGALYIADSGNHCVRRVDRGGQITTVAGLCGYEGSSGDGGPATDARLSRPFGVAVDAAGTLYIADTGNHRIRAVSP